MDSRKKKLTQYVVPTILGNCAYFLFTIIDGIFVGQGVGTDALGAVNLVWPFVMVLNAIIMLTVVGGVTVSAVRIGRGDIAGANQAFMHSLAGTLTAAIIMTLIGTCLTSQIATLLGANETYHRLVCDYLFWYSLFAVPSGLMTFMNNYCRNDGSPVLVSVGSTIATVINIFLDWLFVFPLQKGLMGAAIATGISQTCGMLIVSTHFILRRGQLRVGRFRFSGKLARKLLLRGTPEAIAQFAVPVATLCTNYVLLGRLGDMAVNAYSIICYVASFSAAIFIGVSSGLQPLLGQSYGAKDAQELRWYFRAGVLIDLIGSTLINVVLLFVGGPICKMFGADALTLACTVQYMPRYAWGFIIMSVNTLISAYLYSTKRTKQAVILNLCRSFLLDSAVIFAVPAIFGGNAVWLTMGIYEGLALLLGVVLYEEAGGVYDGYCGVVIALAVPGGQVPGPADVVEPGAGGGGGVEEHEPLYALRVLYGVLQPHLAAVGDAGDADLPESQVVEQRVDEAYLHGVVIRLRHLGAAALVEHVQEYELILRGQRLHELSPAAAGHPSALHCIQWFR